MLPRREHAGYVEEELQQLLMMLRQATARDADADADDALASGAEVRVRLTSPSPSPSPSPNSNQVRWPPEARRASSPSTSSGCGGWAVAC